MLNQPKDQMLDDHVLVRGDRDALNEEMKKHLIGYKEHGVGFEGVGLAEGLPNGEHVLAERPNVEQMMMYYVRGLEQGMDEKEAF